MRLAKERAWGFLGAAVLIFCAATLLVLNYPPQATPVSELEERAFQSASSAKGLHNGKAHGVKKNLSSISKKANKDDSMLSSEGKSIAKEEITVDKLSTQLLHAQKKLNDLSMRRLKVLISHTTRIIHQHMNVCF
jgi:hypothetical protein